MIKQADLKLKLKLNSVSGNWTWLTGKNKGAVAGATGHIKIGRHSYPVLDLRIVYSLGDDYYEQNCNKG